MSRIKTTFIPVNPTVRRIPKVIQTMSNTTTHSADNALLDKLQWRYATKKMNPAKVVPQDKVGRIVEAARLAPTSSGLQPFEVFVVTDAAVRERIKPIA